MKNPQELTQGDDHEATLVTPRFDEEETVLARPVVPLASVGADAPDDEAARAYAPLPPAPSYSPRERAPQRSWMLVLVLVSVLAGSVIGGASLYFYQKGRQAQTPDADAASTQTTAPDEASQPATEPSPEAQTDTAELPTEPAEAPPDENENTDDEAPPPSESKDDDDDDEVAPKPEPERRPAARRPNVGDDSPGTPKQGKKGEGEVRPRRVEQYEDEGGARRVDSIVYPSRAEEREARRAERRARRRERRQQSRSVDRVRGIFEGQP